eukprot:Gb_40963 [translate_table: standard]
MDHKNTNDSGRGNGFNKCELADPLLEDYREIAQELENLAFRKQHENSFSATLEIQYEFPVESSASFNNGSKSERLYLTEKTTTSARIKASLTERLDLRFLDGCDSTSSGENNIPSNNFGVQDLPSKSRSISTSRLGVNGKVQEQLSRKSQDGAFKQIPDGRPKFDGYNASPSLPVDEMSVSCQDYLSSKPANVIMGGRNGTSVRKKELSEQINYMICREETKGLLSLLSGRHSVDTNFSWKVSLRRFHYRTTIDRKEIENLAACNEVVVETVKNDSTSDLVR